MAGRETVAVRLFLPPSDHLPPVLGDGAGVVLQQHPAQHADRRELAQPGRRRAVVDRRQQRVAVAGVGDRQLILLRRGQRRAPGGHRGTVAAGEVAHADPLFQPGRVRRRQGFQRRPHAFPGQLQPGQRRHRRDHVSGIGTLLAARLDQALGHQPCQQRIQRHLLQPGSGHPAPELGQHRVVKARVIDGQAEQVLPVDPGSHRFGRLPVGEVFRPLQHRHQRQPRRRPARPAPGPERGREILIAQPFTQPVTDQHCQRPRPLTGVLGRDRRRDQRIRLRPGHRLHAHDIPGPATGTMDRTRTTTAAGRIMAALYSPSRASSPICDELTTRISPGGKTAASASTSPSPDARFAAWKSALGKDWRGTTGISLAGGSIEPLTSCMPCLTVSSDAVVLGRITAGQTDIRV